MPINSHNSETLAKTLVWFRQDLRQSDNPALQAACEQGQVIPVYVLDDINADAWRMGGASRWWLHHSLTALSESLDSKLLVLAGDALQILPALARQLGVNHVVWNRCYEPWRFRRDRQLKADLLEQGIAVSSFNASLLWEPWQVLKEDGTPYKVFTPFYRKGCRRAGDPPQPSGRPVHINYMAIPDAEIEGQNLTDLQGTEGIAALSLLPDIPWDSTMRATWQVGEQAAQARLSAFLESGLDDYKEGRNFPARPNVSRLSPHLHFGEISPRQVWHQACASALSKGLENQLDTFLSELGWREFSYSLLYHNPDLPEQPIQARFAHFPWQQDKQLLNAWQRGQTGYPLVDAGMRELWQTGYMHNRVRMVVGSFLVKNLRLHWHHGEAWFWDCLLDADLASNSASWQWIAGCGADAAPYFRVFNPVTQSEKFDKQADYIRQYVPELAKLPDKHIHAPFAAPAMVLQQAGIVLGRDYPEPVVDLKTSREQALAAFKSLST